jgi:hypothetical protein
VKEPFTASAESPEASNVRDLAEHRERQRRT